MHNDHTLKKETNMRIGIFGAGNVGASVNAKRDSAGNAAAVTLAA